MCGSDSKIKGMHVSKQTEHVISIQLEVFLSASFDM